MSKIVCDICGATYPETENQCPICGTAKSNASAAGDTAAESGYAYVKGGRFSKSNVKKRNNGQKELPRTVMPVQETPDGDGGMPELEAQKPEPVEEKPAKQNKEPKPRRPRDEEDRPSGSIGLIIIVVILVLAIVAVCVYIGMKWVERINNESTEPSTTVGQLDGTGGTENAGPVSVLCTGLRLPYSEKVLTQAGQTVLLDPIVTPADTTEKVSYYCADARIATVDDNGLVTAVADGETVIYVTCGSYKVEFKVICNVGVAPETTVPPTQPEETEPSVPVEELKLNRTDFTLNGYGDSWNLLHSECTISKYDITWSSSNEDVATVTDGKVVAVGNGSAVITAEYQGQSVTCKVHCKNVVIANFSLSVTSVTIKVGESFTLQAYDAEGLRIDPSELIFSTEKEGFISVDENGKVTGLQNNMNYKDAYKIVYVEYNGVSLKCIVYVKDAS